MWQGPIRLFYTYRGAQNIAEVIVFHKLHLTSKGGRL